MLKISLYRIHDESYKPSEKGSPCNINHGKGEWIIFQKGKIREIVHRIGEKSHQCTISKSRNMRMSIPRTNHKNIDQQYNHSPSHKPSQEMESYRTIFHNHERTKFSYSKLFHHIPEPDKITQKNRCISHNKRKHEFEKFHREKSKISLVLYQLFPENQG